MSNSFSLIFLSPFTSFTDFRLVQADLSRYLGILDGSAVARLKACLSSYGLPTTIKDTTVQERSGYRHCSVDRLLSVMGVDKKNQGRKKRVVLLETIGKVHGREATVVADRDIRVVLSSGIRVSPSIAKSMNVSCIPPGSKSISNRALLLAALGTGTCRIKNFLQSDDTKVMMAALKQMQAASFTWEDDASGPLLVVTGTGAYLQASSEDLYLGNAGTASRFLTTAVTLAKPGSQDYSIVTGNKRMQQRPIGDLVDALVANGAEITYVGKPKDLDEKAKSLPLKIKATSGMEGGNIDLAGNFSSQYVSSILMCAPCAKKPVTLRITGKPISQLYIDLTISMMKSFGIQVTRSSSEQNTYHIPQAKYQTPSEYEIESDASSATYPLAIAAITGTTCTVPNIGSASLQGDARFAVEVLRPMGCEVHQDKHSTTVTGPEKGTLRPIPLIDMETMTDAFLTASVLAAVAQGNDGRSTTKIVGIKNQHKKECDRIAAMETELKKFGVTCRGSEDGIEIDGIDYMDLKEPEGGIHCYDDHRVAMSFSVLSLIAPNGALIQERECVGKTWPNWWDTLRGIFDVKLEGVDLDVPSRASKPSADPERPIYIIGMRGAGKTTTGRWIADLLNRPFTDLDSLLESEEGRTIPEIIKQSGWEGFRSQELDVLKRTIQDKSRNHIYACGGGIVETPEARQALVDYHKSGGLIILVQRNIDDVMAYLQLDKSRPAYVDDMKEVWLRRKDWYAECSNYLHYSQKAPVESLTRASKDLKRFVETITGQRRSLEQIRNKDQQSFFVSLTVPDVADALDILPEIVIGSDAVELRVDLLKDPSNPQGIPSIDFVANQLAILHGSVDISVIFTVRTKSQGGKFPDAAQDEAYALCELALRMGVEFLDLEIQWPEPKLRSVTAMKGHTKIIASHHNPEGTLNWANHSWVPFYNKALLYGDIVKLVGMANSQEDNAELQRFKKWTKSQNDVPLIAINMGREGQLSRIQNEFLTPVTHSALKIPAAPGQLSAAEIRTALSLHGVIKPKKFFLFGKPITKSKSPAMHNACFKAVGLPYSYNLHETDEAKDLEEVLRAKDFGGASVTIPLKLDIMPLLHEISQDAKVIGAVNTIITDPSRHSKDADPFLIGRNTDWQGMIKLLESAGAQSSNGNQSGLVVGGGGTARAAIHALHAMMYSPIYVLGRSPKKIQELINTFPKEYDLKVLKSLQEAKAITVPTIAIGTIPGDKPIDDSMRGVLDHIFNQSTGILLEMAYSPAVTPLMKLAQAWTTIPGLETLAGQGYYQSIAWTGITPHYQTLRDACGLPS